MDRDEASAGNFRRGADECGKTKKVIEPFDKAQDRPMIESSCPSAGIGFLKTFSMAGAIAQDRERGQFLFLLDENPLSYRSARRAVGRCARGTLWRLALAVG